MSITIELPAEIEDHLRAAAARQGQDMAAFVRATVEDKLRAEKQSEVLNGESAQTLDKMLAGLTGVVHSKDGRGSSRLSESTGADMARDLLEKQQGGRL